MCELAQDYFFDDFPSPLQQGIANINNILKFLVKVIWSKKVGTENRLYEPSEESSVIRKKNYIIQLLQKRHFIIDIENVQNIDTQSFEILKDIVEKLEGLTLILEYTINENHSQTDFTSFYNEITFFKAQVSAFSIKALDFSEAKKLAPPNIPEERLASLYSQADGNLVELILSNNTLAETDNPIEEKIASLTKDEKFLVDVIYLNGSGIETALLYYLILGNQAAPPLSKFQIDSIVRKLTEESIIKIEENGTIRIFHDSIISELDNQSPNSILFTAYNILKTHYFTQVEITEDEYAVEQAFCLCMKFSDIDIVAILPHLKTMIMRYKYPQAIVNKLSYFRERLISNEIAYPNIYEISVFLTALCIELGLYEEAQKNLELIYSEGNPYHRALQVAIYSLDYADSNSIEKSKKLFAKATSPRERLIMDLWIISRKMVNYPTATSKTQIEKMLQNNEYKDEFEYSYLLRNYAELIENYDESIAIYEKVIQRFKGHGRDDLCAQVHNSLCMFYAYKGELITARDHLQKATHNRYVMEHYVLNNTAVLDILGQQITDETVKTLTDSLLICPDSYEKIIILCNLLVCYIQLHDNERAQQVVDEIEKEKYEDFEYEEFQHIVYQNLYFYYKSYNYLEQAEKFYNLLTTLINSPGETMALRIARLQRIGSYSPGEFYSKFPFRVDFLGDWNIEISRDLEHY